MMTRRGSYLGLAGLLALVGSSQAQTAYYVSTTVQDVDPSAPLFPASLAGVTIGTPVTISISIDPGASPFPNFYAPPFSLATNYLLFGASIQVTVGTVSFTNASVPLAFVWNNDPITSPTLADGFMLSSIPLYGAAIQISCMTLPTSTFANEGLPTTSLPGTFVLQLSASGAVGATPPPWLTATWSGLTAPPLASYTTFGTGCPGGLGVPSNVCINPPRSGETMHLRFGNLPMNLAVVVLGVSNTVGTFGPLPLDLGVLGAPGCFARVRFDSTAALVGIGGYGDYTLPIPPNPIFLGFTFYTQALAFDAGANSLGLTASDAAVAIVGL